MDDYTGEKVGFGEHKDLTCAEVFERHPEWCQAFYDGTPEISEVDAFRAGALLEWLDSRYHPEHWDGRDALFAALVEKYLEDESIDPPDEWRAYMFPEGGHKWLDHSESPEAGPMKP